MNQEVLRRIDRGGIKEPESIRELRAQVATIERGTVFGNRSFMVEKGILPLGLAEIDRVLPSGGLVCGAVHEVSGNAVGGFVAWLAGHLVRNLGGAVLWCVKPDSTSWPYGPGIAAFGLDAGRLIIVRGRHRMDMLWTMEESLRCPAFAAVIVECDYRIDLVASRRFQLAAEAGGTTGLILRQEEMASVAEQSGTKFPPSACMSRWQVDAISVDSWELNAESKAEQIDMGASGIETRWQVNLRRCRGGSGSGTWLVKHDEATGNLSLVDTSGN